MDKTIKIIMCLAILLFSFNFAFATVETLGTFEKDKCIELLQTCSNCTYNNISSVIYPNSTQALGEVVMTKIGTKYNYTFCNTNISGQYIVNGFGNVDGIATVWAYDFIVTPDGTEPSTSQGFLLFAAIISILVFAILFFGIAIKTENMPVKVLFLCLGIIALVFNLGITIVMIQKYFSTGIAINNVFEGFYNLILILGGVALFLFGIGILIYLITAYKKKRGLID